MHNYVVNSVAKLKLSCTCHSRWCLDVFAVEMLNNGLAFLCWFHSVKKFRLYDNKVWQRIYIQYISLFSEDLADVPGKADSSAGTVGIAENACGDHLAEGLQHALQLLLVHGQGQVGDIQVGRILLLLLQKELKFKICPFSVIWAFYNTTDIWVANECVKTKERKILGIVRVWVLGLEWI